MESRQRKRAVARPRAVGRAVRAAAVPVLALLLPLVGQSQPVSIPASVDVSATGAASYTIPIEVVPGVDGVQPGLAVVYNSLSGDGLLGPKWSLQGISSVSRVPQTRYFDGNVRAVGYDTADRFSLDGSRLLLHTGSSYQADGAVYCFEVEDFSRVAKVADGGSFYFRQTFDDGRTAHYGRENKSRYRFGSDKCVAWMLDKVSDLHGNYMTYHYQQTSGEILLDRIDYVYAPGNAEPQASVAFEYENKNRPNDLYLGGCQLRQWKRLKSIAVNYQGVQVRKYEFQYAADAQGDRLSAIVLRDGSSAQLTATMVEWGLPSASTDTNIWMPTLSGGYYLVAGNFDDDRLYDIFAVNKDTRTAYVRKGSEGGAFGPFQNVGYQLPWQQSQSAVEEMLGTMIAGDIDGDGVDEILFRRPSDGACYSIKINGTGQASVTQPFYSTAYSSIVPIFTMGDFDGDGVLEPIAFRDGRYLYAYQMEGLSDPNHTFGNTYDQCLVGDFDGDGKSDLFLVREGTADIYTYDLRSHTWISVGISILSGKNIYCTAGDFNGDGMTDILYLPQSGSLWKMSVRRGGGLWTTVTVAALDSTHVSPLSTMPLRVPLVCDIDGDGKSDILQEQASGAMKYILSGGFYNNAYQIRETGLLAQAAGQSLSAGRIAVGDFDGNGTADILFHNPSVNSQTPSAKYFYKGSLPARFVSRLEDGAGREVRWQYSTISTMPYRYTGTGMRWMPLPLVKDMLTTDGKGGLDTTRYHYGEAQYAPERSQFLGFSLFGTKNRERITETFFSRLRRDAVSTFAMLMPDSVMDFVVDQPPAGGSTYSGKKSHFVQPSPDILVSKTVSVNRSVSRTNTAGTVSFRPYADSTYRYDYLRNTKITQHTVLASNWRVGQQSENKGSIAGSAELPFRQTVNYSYGSVTLQNGVTAERPVQVYTVNYNTAASTTNVRRDTVRYTYDEGGRLTQEKHTDNSSLSVVKDYLYTPAGQIASVVTTPRGEAARSVSYTYDATRRFVAGTSDHAGNSESRTYDGATGLCLTETDINGLTTSHQYDSWGRQVLTTYPDGRVKAVAYVDSSSGLAGAMSHVRIAESGRPSAKVYYDILGRKICTYEEGRGFMAVEYDCRGRVARETVLPDASSSVASPAKEWRVYTYDRFGRVVRDSSRYLQRSHAYNAVAGDHRYNETVQDQRGGFSVKYYDADGRVVRVDDNGGTVTYTYGRAKAGVDIYDQVRIVAGGSTTIVYTDSRGNKIQLEDPDAGTVYNTWNAWDEQLTQWIATGHQTAMTYDNQGRLASKTHVQDGVPEVFTYVYGTSAPRKGRLTHIFRNGALYRQVIYDSLSRVSLSAVRIGGMNYTHQYTYDSLGRVRTTTYPSGYTVRHEYDTLGRLASLKDHATGAEIYTVDRRNARGQVERCWFGNQTGAEYTYNAQGLATQIRYGYKEVAFPPITPVFIGGDELQDTPGGDDPITPTDPGFFVGNQYSQLQYVYDAAGYITGKSDAVAGQQESYSYDTLGRLSSYTVNGTQSYTFAYSGNGNIRRNGRLGSDDYEYWQQKPHAVRKVYDGAGLTPSAQCDVTYNSRNRAGSISADGWRTELFYSDDLRREQEVQKHGDTVKRTVHFIAKDSEREVAAGVVRYLDYIEADGRVVAVHVHNVTAGADSLYYVQSDLLGSWERVTDGSRSVVQASHFSPWGDRMEASDWGQRQEGEGLAFRRGFTGHRHYDRFGIVNMGARLYDPATGRFFSPDPQVQDPLSTQGYNRYSYCGNNPVMYVDEDGEFALLAAILIGAIVGGGVNLAIHASQGDVRSFGQGLAYFGQGAVAGAIVGAGWWGGIGLAAGGSAWGYAFLGVQGANAAATTLSAVRNPGNAVRILLGGFYFDENILHGFSQALTRYTVEVLQTEVGYLATQVRNMVGRVDRVDYLGGATFATYENNGTKESRGVTIGSFINMSLSGEIDRNFKDYVMTNQLYMHEYGHTIQSQITGLSYLLAIGLPSLISAALDKKIEGDPYGASTHDYFYTETWANRIGNWYFNRNYGYTWVEKDGKPLHDYR